MSKKLPKHIAIIMDGNGRWAKFNNKTRLSGHKKGVGAVRKIIQKSKDLGIKTLTLYTFSKDNWKRPKDEVSGLMQLLYLTLKEEFNNFHRNDIRVSFIGDINSFPKKIINLVDQTIETTSNNESLNLNIALGYSSREEITNVARQITKDVLDKTLNMNQIDSDLISDRLENSYLGNPDLLIRTGGESRVSDFLLWQIAYSEIYFTDIYWPDFDEDEYSKAISDYQKRERRFGKISEQIS